GWSRANGSSSRGSSASGGERRARLIPLRRPHPSREADRVISFPFIDRPRLALVISVVITLAGLLALTRLPVAQFPDIVPPQVSVRTTYLGANAETVASAIGQPIEAQVNGVENMIYMSSTSGND